MFALVCGGAFATGGYAAFDGQPLDIADTVHRAFTFSRVGLDQLIREVTGA
ncbi:hypothetical protein D3C79_1033000 [compost metagenome]